MDLDVVFVGTAGSMPTAQRGPAATLVRRGGERLLFDCGEGTQRQLLRSDVGLVELREIFLTHFHADHFLGLPGMLKTFALRGRELPLTLYGPAGLGELMGSLRRIFGRLTYPYDVVELRPGDVLGARRLRAADVRGPARARRARLRARRGRSGPGGSTSRSPIASVCRQGPSAGMLQRGESVTLPSGAVVTPFDVLGPPRAGSHVVLSGDTSPVQSVVEAAQGADLLVHEATFCEDEADRARETEHSTAARGGSGSRARRA